MMSDLLNIFIESMNEVKEIEEEENYKFAAEQWENALKKFEYDEEPYISYFQSYTGDDWDNHAVKRYLDEVTPNINKFLENSNLTDEQKTLFKLEFG